MRGPVRVAVLGWRPSAGRLCRAWADVGHEVYLGLADPEGPDAQEIRAVLPQVEVLDLEDAAGADVVVLATPAAHAAEILGEVGDLEGRVVVDATFGPGDAGVDFADMLLLQLLAPTGRAVRVRPDADWRSAFRASVVGLDPSAVRLIEALLHDAGVAADLAGGSAFAWRYAVGQA